MEAVPCPDGAGSVQLVLETGGDPVPGNTGVPDPPILAAAISSLIKWQMVTIRASTDTLGPETSAPGLSGALELVSANATGSCSV